MHRASAANMDRRGFFVNRRQRLRLRLPGHGQFPFCNNNRAQDSADPILARCSRSAVSHFAFLKKLLNEFTKSVY
jgi:hypothetical protein